MGGDCGSLAGQPDDYVQWQVVYFRRGARKSAVMGPIAQALDNEQIRNLGAYYASLLLPKPAPLANADEMAQDGEKVAAFPSLYLVSWRRLCGFRRRGAPRQSA
jgi:cytochrome c553